MAQIAVKVEAGVVVHVGVTGLPMLRLLLPSVTLCMLAGSLVATGVRAQTDLDAGKSGPQLFSQDCVTCHRSPQGLLKNTSSFGLVGFLRQHYTSSSASANTLAAYLQSAATARPPADPKKGKSQDSQQAKQSPKDPRAAPATAPDAAQAHARQGEPPADQPVNRRQRRQAPGENGATPPAEPTTAARPSAPEPEAPSAPAQQTAAAPQATPPQPPPEPGFAEPLP
jgi:hypothetical protein